MPDPKLIHQRIVRAYQQAVTFNLLTRAFDECPTNMNYIDPESLEFVYRGEYSSNFGGYTALRKFGEPNIDIKACEQIGHGQHNVTFKHVDDFMLFQKIVYRREMHCMLMDIDSMRNKK